MIDEKLSKSALKCMYTSSIIRLIIFLSILGLVNYFYILKEDILFFKILSVILLILFFIDGLINPYFRYNRYRYTINEECIDIKEGYIFKKRSIVPIERLHKLETHKGPIDQLFKVEKVILTTAGGDVTISFLEEKKAEEIADSLRKKINQIAVMKREKVYGE